MKNQLHITHRLLALIFALFSGTHLIWAQPQGAIPHAFSVSANTHILFSQGNLQYRASTSIWRFAENQWDYVGNDNGNISQTYDGWIDLFRWGTSGYNHGAVCYQPWSTSATNSNYYAYGSSNYNLYDQTGKADWGYNAISNGGNMTNKWRTLTQPEWAYIINTRSTASGIRFAKALVNNVNGVILLPDDWSSSYYTLNSANTASANYSTNTITTSQWSTLEQHGAVFLPAAGNYSTSGYGIGTIGYYWLSSCENQARAYQTIINSTSVGTASVGPRSVGRSVRLVHDTFIISATPNPTVGGSVSGNGLYDNGSTCTLTAVPSQGYTFVSWTENGVIVSANPSYSFTVTTSRELVANFVVDGNIVFSDINVKALCIANWDTNGDSELSYAEAATVTNLSTVFKNKTNITSFNELQYFIGLGSIGEQAFYGCTALTQVTIPENVATVGSQSFWNCPALQTVYFNAINCTSMQSTYNSNTYSVFSSNASGGASALTRVVVGSSVTRIPDYAFKGSVDIYQRLVIPASVTEIGQYAFYNCNSMVQMVIQGNGLQTIGEYAFYDCSALANALNLPNSVSAIGQYAFYGCSVLPSATFGTGITSIGGYAFWNCPNLATVNFNPTNCTSMVTNSQYSVFNSGTSNTGATPIVTLNIGNNVTKIPDYAFRNSTNLNSNIIIPNATTSIGTYAFYGAKSTTLTIGTGVTSIGGYAFWNCPNLATVNFNATNCTQMYTNYNSNNYSVFSANTTGGNPAITTLTIGSNVTKIPDYAFRNSTNLTSNIIIPNTTTSIGTYAFYGAKSTTLTTGTGVTSIGGYAFWNCPNLVTVNFNATNCTTMVTNSQYSVFNSGTSDTGATPIVTLSIESNVTKIPDYAFRNSTNLTSNIIIPNATTSIGTYAFYGAKSATLTIGTGVASIGGYAFWNCPNLTTVSFNPTNCTTMVTNSQYSVFNSGTSNSGATPIVTLNIGSNVTKIPDYAFRNSANITGSLTLPSVLTTIGQYAFYGCNHFTGNLTIPNSVTTLGQYAFYNCSGFNGNLTLPSNSSLTEINQYTFYGCSGLNGTLTIPANIKTIGSSAFRGCGGFTGALILHNAMTTISDYAFYGCTHISSLTIGAGITTIGGYAFWNCPNLATVNFNATNCTTMVTNSQYSVFNSGTSNGGTTPIVTLNIGSNVTKIPNYAFRYSTLLSNNLVIPNSVAYIGEYAFAGSTGQSRTLLLGDALTSIGQYAFQGCSGFTGDLVIPNAVTTLNQYAFQGCSGFNGSLIIGSGVTTINPYTFADCSGFLGSLIVGRQVNSVGNYAFKNCNGFSNVISENPTPPTAVNNSFQSMNFSIPLYVPYAMMPAYQNAAGWSQFTNRVEQCVFDQLDNDLWSDANNWYAFALPGPNDVVCVNSNCHMDVSANVLHLYVLNLNDVLTINSGKSLTTTYGVGTLQASQLVIADGASLYNPISNAYGTVQKTINGYGSGNNGWYTIASPIYCGTPASTIATGTYDLYRYDEPTHYWRNQKVAANNLTTLNAAQGYLYASQSTRTLSLAGQLNASNAEFSVPVTYQGSPLAGYTLVGNPYTHNLSIGDVKLNGTALTTYYKIVDGNSLTAYTSATPIKPGEAFLVMAPQGGTLTFSPSRNHIGDGTEPEGGDRELVRGFRLPTHSGVTDIDAFFADNITITATASPEAGGTVSGAGTYTYGASCTLIATANDHYTFDHWTKNGTQVSTEATYTFSVTEEASYVANFSIATYALTATANPSTAGTVTGAGSYAFGTSCTLTATPSIGYQFVNWTMGDAVVSTSNSFTFTVSEAGDYVANFEICTYEVTAEAIPEEGGTVSGAGTFTYGQTTTLTATPNPGYEFDHWSEGYELQYFTIESLEDGNTITLTIPGTVPSTRVQSVSYSTDGGTTWHTTAIDETDQTINVTLGTGQRVIWKGTGKGYATANEASSYSIFSSTGSYEVKGNIASLLYGDDFIGKTTFPSNDVRAFQGLFFGSNKLVSAEKLVLPFMTLKGQCYKSMFQGCTSLAQVPELPATSLATNCYYSMFQNCRALTTAPELKATTLAPECYTAMFAQCIMLTQGPELPAHTLSGGCYRQMFMSCTSLNEVTCFATDVSASNCTQNWLLNVASTGTFHKAEGMTGWPTGASGIPSGWTVKDHIEDYAAEYFTIESLEDGNTITLTIGSAVTSANLTYVAWSKDKTNWTSTTVDDTEQVISVPANAHEKVYWKGEGTTYATSGDNSTGQSIFSTSKAFDVSGNIMSLLYGDDFVGQTSLPNNTRTFANLLSQNLCLINAKHLKLLATTMAQNCYQYLFSGCSALTTVPELPATELTVCCYQYMFMGCVSLTNAPELPASTMKTYCYRGMFRDCTSLTKAPALPATTVAQSCYEAMFYGCSSLGETPALPATALANACYKDMFYGCTSLTTAPTLPANDLTFRCYRAMFKGCSSLTKAPALPAAVLMDECYNQMFTNCSSLNEVTCLATDISATDCLTNWLGNVASTGTFYKSADMTGWSTGASGIPNGWAVEDYIGDYATEYFTIESLEDGNTITLTIGAPVTQAQMQNISYSIDGGATWNTTTVDDTEQVISVSINANEKVLWKGTGVCMASSWQTSSWCTFNGTKQHVVYGNIASLLFGDDFEGQTVMPIGTNSGGRNYQRLFSGDTKLVSAQHLILPFTTLRQICYWHMFSGCTSLTTAPELLPATTLTYICYGNMFMNCSSLTTVPELPATSLAQECYSQMFRGCTSLTTAPELPATTLANKCYQLLFNGCSLLSEVTCLATDISATDCTASWLYGVSSTGTFHKAEGMTGWPTGANGIPTGWTTEDITPETPTINLNEPTLSIRVTEPKHYVAYFSPIIATQTFALAQGWNWWAPTVATSIETVEQALGDTLVSIQSKQGSASGEAIAGDMYRIQTNAACTLSLSGMPMGTATVALQAGSNWFGYTGDEEKAIAEAVSVEAATGDKIVSQNGGFAIYNGTAWQGTLTTLQPGCGYVYVTTESKTLVIE